MGDIVHEACDMMLTGKRPQNNSTVQTNVFFLLDHKKKGRRERSGGRGRGREGGLKDWPVHRVKGCCAYSYLACTTPLKPLQNIPIYNSIVRTNVFFPLDHKKERGERKSPRG